MGQLFALSLYMATPKQLKFTSDIVIFPLLLVMLLWVVFWAEIRFGLNLNFLGVFPRTVSGLVGIVTGPLVHGSLKHLFNNSVPLFVLTTALFYFHRNIKWRVFIYGWILTGFATWLIGRPSLHIGISGVVYMLVAFLFFSGVRSKQYQLIAVSLVVVFLYGGLWWYVFPVDPAISWEGHLSGFFVGLVFALIFKIDSLPVKKYEWQQEDYDAEKDPFLRQFDENGNFVGFEKTPETEEDLKLKSGVRITYTFKESSKKISEE